MLSVCIPVFNYDVRQLVYQLYDQIKSLKFDAEINILDDGSDSVYRKLNSELTSIKTVHYKEQENKGRSVTRNSLGQMANGSHIIFIDCDCLISDQFLTNYKNHITSDVVIGGLKYGNKPKDRSLRLRWNYGRKRESKIDYSGNKMAFLSSNFMIKKELFHSIGFDTSFDQYGHEDTMLGLQLRKLKIPIFHINNPVFHMGLEPSIVFLQKTEQALQNVTKLISTMNTNDYKDNTLIRLYLLKTPVIINLIMSTLYKIHRPILKWMLQYIYPSILLFDIYKLLFIFHMKYKAASV